MTTATALEVRWDLSELYRSHDDPRIEADTKALAERIARFAKNRGAALGASPAQLRALIEEYEAISASLARLAAFAELHASTDQMDEKRTALRDSLQEKASRWVADLVFFDLELKKIPEERAKELLAAKELAPYRHWLVRLRSLARYTLSEPEERVIVKKNVAGRDAIVQFREEYASKISFAAKIGGKEQKTEEDLLNVLRASTVPEEREQAANRLYGVYREQEHVFQFLYKNIVRDHAISCELRGFEHPIDVENIPNEIPREVVTALVASTRKHLHLAHEYYRWKGKVLGMKRMRTCDRLAPIGKSKPHEIRWSEARALVEKGLERFDPEFARLGREIFERRRIDAPSVPGKRGGGFCYPVPEADPWILVNFTDDVDSVFTVAHEVGHGIHFMLARKKQRLLQAYEMSKVLAETASEFGESLLLDRLLEDGKDDALKVHVLTHACDGFLGTVNRQVCFTEFELAAHEEAKERALTLEFCKKKWEELCRAYYGPHVDLMPDEPWGYAAIPHFFFNPFYCLSYALSQVAVLALYGSWKAKGKSFVPGYRELLEGGGSGTPVELLGRAGVDLRDPTNLDRAFETFKDRMEKLKALVPG
ncbi:MAG TPA: M3 family oligoendopeptidase [Planctomycetota bacterium]|nr:M3 family oligoendopeptidase [Planctomycetota bacterium]